MIGVIGLGNMGHAIAQRLLAEGESLIVWNRSKEKAQGLNGAQVAQTPAEVVQASNIIISVLGNDEATQAVYFGDDGVLSVSLSNKCFVELCTMAPARAIELEQAIIANHGLFLECPVGGTIGPALEGKLLGLAGGSDEAFTCARPVLQKLTRRLEHFGPTGTGAAMKLAINLPLMVYWSALGEALELALSHDIDPAMALDVLADSSGAIGAAKKRVPPIRDMVLNGDSGTTNFSLENAIKDMQLMQTTAVANGGSADLVAQALQRALMAQQNGFEGLDCSLVAAWNNLQK